MATSDIKVVLIEDDTDLRESVVEWLTLAGMQVTAVGSAGELYRLLPREDFHVAVIDVGLPDQSGFVLAEYVRANTGTAVIMLSARSTIDDKIKGYNSGADLYLLKPVDCRELSAAIVSIAQRTWKAARDTPPAQEIWSISTATWQLALPGETQILLSVKELKFIELLGATPGQPVLRKTLLSELYNRNDDHTGRALDSLVRRLRAKIASQTDIAIPITTVHAVGYCFIGAIAIR